MAFWLSVPGSVRLSLTSGPTVRAATASEHEDHEPEARTTQRWRTQNLPEAVEQRVIGPL